MESDIAIGIDFATGKDETVIACRRGNKIRFVDPVLVHGLKDSKELEGLVELLSLEVRARSGQ